MAKVAIMGFGTVGSGVAEVLAGNAASIEKKAGEPVEVKYILDLREFPDSPFADKIVHDFSVIENDPEVTVVAECIGGARIAREKNVNYLFEASVGGGIPILRPLTSCLAANEITEIYGILNGTTNYILTKMIKEGLSFDTALRQAQEKGYAEADPTADIEGHDACRKICILASLAFGRHVYPRQVPTTGITGVTSGDVALAHAAGKRIKLLGRTLRLDDGKIIAYVAPHLIDDGEQLAGVEDVFNGIVVRGNAIGDVMPKSVMELMPAPAAWGMKLFAGNKKVSGEIFEQNCTALPIGTALAQSWNLHFAERCGDLVMPGCPGDLKALLNGLKDGAVTRKQLLINASRVVRMAKKLTEAANAKKEEKP